MRSSGMTCSKRSGPTEISPVKGALWEAINTTETATPVAKRPIAMAAVARLSLWTLTLHKFRFG